MLFIQFYYAGTLKVEIDFLSKVIQPALSRHISLSSVVWKARLTAYSSYVKCKLMHYHRHEDNAYFQPRCGYLA